MQKPKKAVSSKVNKKTVEFFNSTIFKLLTKFTFKSMDIKHKWAKFPI